MHMTLQRVVIVLLFIVFYLFFIFTVPESCLHHWYACATLTLTLSPQVTIGGSSIYFSDLGVTVILNQSLYCHFFRARSLCFLLCTQQASDADLLSERVNNVLGASPSVPGNAKCF